ncbi:MAG: pyruvate kinase, partial [Actinomycetota bacterium]|nr:pyruvate kinase [Actinomycetota bacterium]
MKRKTKIVATLGPAIDSLDSVREMVGAGLNVARFNFSHGTAEEHARRHEWVRTAASEAGVSVATMQDIQGPKIRVGTFPGGAISLEQGA